jgi:hypothetical protein
VKANTMFESNHQAALHDLEKVLALIRLVPAPEGPNDDGVERLLEMAVASYKEKMAAPIDIRPKFSQAAPQLTPLSSPTR